MKPRPSITFGLNWRQGLTLLNYNMTGRDLSMILRFVKYGAPLSHCSGDMEQIVITLLNTYLKMNAVQNESCIIMETHGYCFHPSIVCVTRIIHISFVNLRRRVIRVPQQTAEL